MKNRDPGRNVIVRKTLAIACLAILAQVVDSQVLGDEKPLGRTVPNGIAGLETSSEQGREAVLQETVLNLREIQEVLMRQLGSTNNDVKCCAAYLLGEYRFSQAAGALSQVINLESRIHLNAREWFWDHHPAMEALVKIGNPSIPVVIQNLEDSDDVQVRELSVTVIHRIEKDKDIAELRLQKALEAQTDAKKKARLQSALKSLAEIRH